MATAFIPGGELKDSSSHFILSSRISSIQLHFIMASGALHSYRFVCPLKTGNPVTKINPCVIAVVADRKAAGNFHAWVLEIHEYEHQVNAV
jgi:hypothetical protein